MSNKEVVKELVEKLLTIESEINLLQEDRKITLSDYKDTSRTGSKYQVSH